MPTRKGRESWDSFEESVNNLNEALINQEPAIIEPFQICTGEILKELVGKQSAVHECYISALIPKLSIIQFYAPDGIGKSTILTQIAVQSTSGSPVFGGFPCEKPLRVLLLPTERPKEETFERIKLMMPHCSIHWENLAVEEMLGYDVLNYKMREDFIKKVIDFDRVFNPDIIILDPIYAMVSKDLNNETAGSINTVLLRIQAITKKTIAYTHHANRGIKNKDTGVREHEDMYGGRFLSAKCTGVFKIKESEGGTVLLKEKDSYRCLADKITLKFDKETYLSHVDASQTIESGLVRIESFIRQSRHLKKDFYFEDLLREGGVSTSLTRLHLGNHLKSGSIINLKPQGVKALYRIIRDI